MSRQHRSISQRMTKAKSPERRAEIAREWGEEWGEEQSRLINAIGQAIARNDYDGLCRATGQLKAMSEKRFTALPRVINSIAEAGTDDIKPE